MPTFTIITMTLNNLDGLIRTAHSIRAQKPCHYEWIVIDGGSEDGTASYLQSKDIMHISEPDQGIYDAMNKGIERASGEYLLFLNAGDTLAADDVLKAIEEQTQRTKPDFIYGDAIEGGQYKPARSHKQIDWGLFTHHQAMFYKRETLADLRYNTNYKIAADYALTRQFLSRAADVYHHPHAVCVFEPGGVSQQNAAQGRNEQFQIRKEQGVRVVKNTLIYIGQMFIWMVRGTCPGLYWWLKRRL